MDSKRRVTGGYDREPTLLSLSGYRREEREKEWGDERRKEADEIGSEVEDG